MSRQAALIEADREISRLIGLGCGLFYIAEAYGVPPRRLGNDMQLALDQNYQALPEHLKGSPGVLTLDYLRHALAYKIMGIWVNEAEKTGRDTKRQIRAVRRVRQRTQDQPRQLDYDRGQAVSVR
ncbi:MAG: hypothetical protein ACPICC_02910 [Candidatus Puniceispirillaceae bacterium]